MALKSTTYMSQPVAKEISLPNTREAVTGVWEDETSIGLTKKCMADSGLDLVKELLTSGSSQCSIQLTMKISMIRHSADRQQLSKQRRWLCFWEKVVDIPPLVLLSNPKTLDATYTLNTQDPGRWRDSRLARSDRRAPHLSDLVPKKPATRMPMGKTSSSEAAPSSQGTVKGNTKSLDML